MSIEAYPVMKRRTSRPAMWLAKQSVKHGAMEPRADRAPWSWTARVLVRLTRILSRLEQPQMRWQAEWDGCRKAPRALTRRGVLRKAQREVSRG